MTERSTEQNMADASKDAALPTPPDTPAPLPKKFPKGVVLGKDGKAYVYPLAPANFRYR